MLLTPKSLLSVRVSLNPARAAPLTRPLIGQWDHRKGSSPWTLLGALPLGLRKGARSPYPCQVATSSDPEFWLAYTDVHFAPPNPYFSLTINPFILL